MLAVAASLGIFVFCTIVGFGVIAALGTEDKPYLPLLAPILGAATLIIPGIWLSELGMPMAQAGPIVLLTVLAAATFSIVRARRRIRLTRYWPFAVIVLAGFLSFAWPLFQFGFNWLSYSNDDMANYALNAERLVELGWYTVPDFTTYNFNRDPTAVYWLWTVDNERFGAEMFVTLWLSALPRVNAFQLFMPVMAALGMMQISAAAALVYRNETFRLAALLTASLMAICSLCAFGIEYQLLAQVFGIGLLIAVVTLICDLPERLSWRSVLLATVAATGLAMVYPEATPFAFIAVGAYFGIRVVRNRLEWSKAGLWLGLVSLATTILLNVYVRNFASVIWQRVLSSSGPCVNCGQAFASPVTPEGVHVGTYVELFPFYLIPSGLPMFFGFYSAVQGIIEPWQSLGILAAIILFIATIVVVVRAARRTEPAAAPAVTMFALGFLLFYTHNGFGLFKLAMYVQPFMIACLVPWFLRRFDKLKLAAAGVLVLFVLLNIQTQLFYVDRSRAGWSKKGATFVEIPNASASHLLDEFGQLSKMANPSVDFIADTSNVVFGKIEAYFAKPSNIIYPSSNFLPGVFVMPDNPVERALMIPWMVRTAMSMRSARQKFFKKPYFLFQDDYSVIRLNSFFSNSHVPALERRRKGVVFLEDTAAQSIVNRWYSSDTRRNFDIVPIDRVKNHLIFVASRYGLDYYSRSRMVGLYQLEPDLFYRQKTMAGMGRRLLFEVVNPSPKIRLEINYTATLKDDGKSSLYDPSVLGSTMTPRYAHVIGRGSARVFMPVVPPRILVGQPYLMLDMNVSPTFFPFSKTGLMNLYGRNIPLDGRLLVGFVRDISAISEEDYQNLRRPSFLSSVRRDLADPHLEYSGAYEDGWVAEASQYVLSQRADQTVLAIRGLVPLIDDQGFHSKLRVLADNREVGRANLPLGTFNFQFPVRHAGPHVRVTVLFDRVQRLPNDGRPAAAELFELGFLTPRDAARRSRSAVVATTARSNWITAAAKARIEFGAGWYPVETYDGLTFRWADNDARIVVDARTTNRSELAIDVEAGPGVARHAGQLRLTDARGRTVATAVVSERRTLVLPLPASAARSTYVLHVDGGGTVVPGDPRTLNFRVFGIWVE